MRSLLSRGLSRRAVLGGLRRAGRDKLAAEEGILR